MDINKNTDLESIFELLADLDVSVIFETNFTNDILNTPLTVVYSSFENLGLYDIYTINDLFKYIDIKSEIPEVVGLEKYLTNLKSTINNKDRLITQYIPLKTNGTTIVYNLKALKEKNKCFFYLHKIDMSLINLEQLYSNSYKDKLTGLFNRNALKLHVSNNTDDHYFGFFDIDGFKQINDTYSHNEGDNLLKRIGEKLISIANENIVFYRYGGDEFVFMTIGINNLAINDLVNKIKNEINQIETHGIKTSISLGYTAWNSDFQYPQIDAIRIADIGMYHSKINGKDQITFVDEYWISDILNGEGIDKALDNYRIKTKKNRRY